MEETQAARMVVVGVDGSEAGQRALRYAIAEAHRRGNGLRLVHVYHETQPVTPMLPYVPTESLHEVGARVLDDVERQAHSWSFDGMVVDSVLTQGSRTAGLLHNAADASCIVLGTRGAVMRRLLAGSTTTSVAAHARVPVHCVPEAWSPVVHERGRLVVGIDGTEASMEVLLAAFAEARIRSAELDIVHAWPLGSSYNAATGGGFTVREWEDTTHGSLTKMVEQAVGPDLGVSWRLRLHMERPVEALYEAAFDADLLILGRRGRWGPFSLGLGSVARTMLRAAICPVVILPVTIHRHDEPETVDTEQDAASEGRRR